MVIYLTSLFLWPSLAIQAVLFQTVTANILEENKENMQLKVCDSILVGHSKQGVCVSIKPLYVPKTIRVSKKPCYQLKLQMVEEAGSGFQV